MRLQEFDFFDNTGKMTFASMDSGSGDSIRVNAEDKGPVGGFIGTDFKFDPQNELNIDLDEFGCDNCD